MKQLSSDTKFAHLGKPGTAFTSGFQRRLDQILKLVNLDNKSILDQGCGEGVWLEKFSEYTDWDKIYGFDIDPESVELLKKQNPNLKSENIKVCPGEELEFDDETFDIVLSNEVLEHVVDDKKVVAETLRVLKPGGKFIIFTPNRGWPFETHGAFFRGKYYWGNIPFLPWMPKVVRKKFSLHVRNYGHFEIKKVVTANAQEESETEKVLIIPGFNGQIKDNWKEWAFNELRGVDVELLDLPESNTNLSNSLNYIESKYSDVLNSKGRVSIISHSAGAGIALKLSEKYDLNKLILVAPVVNATKDNSLELQNYYSQLGSYDLFKLKENINKVTVLFDAEDSVSGKDRTSYMIELLKGAKFIELKGKGHFTHHENVSTLPELLTMFKPVSKFKIIHHSHVFPGFDKLARKYGLFGKMIQKFFHLIEKTPLNFFGISHFIVAEKVY
ncbi:MAG: methyltransferase domain-containing protein [Candidatus Dojkabacteria bacterium]|nr:methyltransferase domain-containing protein [Candidatus Dojkabacteria bacterium]